MKLAKKETQVRAKDLRFNQTTTERLLWGCLRNRQINGLKFRRQHPIGFYIVDFFCAETNLIIEVDGDSHLQRVEYDQRRTLWLEEQGLRVIRFTNEEVLNSMDEILRLIAEACAPS